MNNVLAIKKKKVTSPFDIRPVSDMERRVFLLRGLLFVLLVVFPVQFSRV